MDLTTVNTKRKLFSMIAIFLMLTMAVPLTFLATTSAHTPAWNIPSFAYLAAQPSPVGVGQTVQVYMWVDAPFPSAAEGNDYQKARLQAYNHSARWKHRRKNVANHLGYNWSTILFIYTRPSRHVHFTI